MSEPRYPLFSWQTGLALVFALELGLLVGLAVAAALYALFGWAWR